MPQSISFGVRPVDALKLRTLAGWSSNAREANSVLLEGPSELLSALPPGKQHLATLSPAALITVQGETAKSIGVVQGTHFAFLYPLELSPSEVTTLITCAGIQSRASHSMHKHPGHSTPAWLDLVLIGGFIYFDDQHTVLQANALCIELPNALKIGTIGLEGPFEAASAAIEYLDRSRRMRPVTIESIKALGFDSFGWVNPAERPGGVTLGKTGPEPLHGAFVYSRLDSNKRLGECYYYRIALPEEERGRSPNKLGRSVLGAGVLGARARALDDELRRSLLTLAATIRDAHKMIDRKLKQDAHIKLMASKIVNAGRLSRASRWSRMESNQRSSQDLLKPKDAQGGGRGRWLRHFNRRWLGRVFYSLPAATAVLAAAVLLWVAYAASRWQVPLLHRAVASFIWFTCLTELTWRVLRDCATEGLSARRLVLMRCCLPAIPLLATGVELGLLSVAWRGVCASCRGWYADIAALSTVYLLAFGVLPLAVYLPRRSAARAAILRMATRRRVGKTNHQGKTRADALVVHYPTSERSLGAIRLSGVGAADAAAAAASPPAAKQKVNRKPTGRLRVGFASTTTPAAPEKNASAPEARASVLAPMAVYAVTPPAFMGPPSPPPIGVYVLPPTKLLSIHTLSTAVQSMLPPPACMGPPIGRPSGRVVIVPPSGPKRPGSAIGTTDVGSSKRLRSSLRFEHTEVGQMRFGEVHFGEPGVAVPGMPPRHFQRPRPPPVSVPADLTLADSIEEDTVVEGNDEGGGGAHSRRAGDGPTKDNGGTDSTKGGGVDTPKDKDGLGVLAGVATWVAAKFSSLVSPTKLPADAEQATADGESSWFSSLVSPTKLPADAEQATADGESSFGASPMKRRITHAANNLATMLAHAAKRELELAAVIRLQSRARLFRSNTRLKRVLLQQQRRLCYISWPILLAALIEIVGSLVLDAMQETHELPEWVHIFGWLLLLLPSVAVVIVDLGRSYAVERLYFSIAHAVFFAGCLYRVSFRAAAFSTGLMGMLRRPPWSDQLSDANASLLGYVTHMFIFYSVKFFAQSTLRLASIENAFAHLLFPFHFFELSFGYAFFALRKSYVEDFRGSWFAITAAIATNQIMHNSGTYDGLITYAYQSFHRRSALRRGRKPPPHPSGPDDALFRLQFYARLAIQYDIADVTAILVVPTCVTLFVVRDGSFVLEGTSVLVRPCDLFNMWMHFVVLLFAIKPCTALFARKILERNMARTLLGLNTLHGRSAIAPDLLRTVVKRSDLASKRRSERKSLGDNQQSSRSLGELGERLVSRGRQILSRLKRQGSMTSSAVDDVGRISSLDDVHPPRTGKWAKMGARVIGPVRMQRLLAAREHKLKHAAATHVQRHGRGLIARKRFMLLKLQSFHGTFHGERLIRHVSAKKLTNLVLDNAFDRLGFSDERKKLFAHDFEIANLDYRSLFARTVQSSYFFFAMSAVFQLFAVFPRYGVDPQGDEPARASWFYLDSHMYLGLANRSGAPEVGCG